MIMQIRTNDGRGIVEVEADVIRADLGLINFYKKRTTTIRREACTVGLWPFRKTFPERDEKSTTEDWALSLAPEIIVEIRPAQVIEAQRAETENTGSVADESAVGNADAPKGESRA